MTLTDQHCTPCKKNGNPIPASEVETLLVLVPGWQLSADGKRISRAARFADFAEALAFANRVGDLAESEGHHPDIHLTDYKNVRLELSTHAVGGLSRNDFILAAKIDALPELLTK